MAEILIVWHHDSHAESLRHEKNDIYYKRIFAPLFGATRMFELHAEKLARLRERGMIDESGRVAVMVARTGVRDEIESIPSIGESVTRRFADAALEYALNEAKKYPPQMQDLIVQEESRAFSGSVVALMARKILFDRGVWKPLADAEKAAVDLMVFSDVLPTDE